MSVLERLLSRVNEMTAKLDALAGMSLEDWVVELAVLHALQVQAQALLDIVQHIAAELGYAPESPGEAARALHREGMLLDDEYELVRRVIGFRNVLVHEYAVVDMGLVSRILGERLYRRVALLAAGLVERAWEQGLDP